MTQPEDTIQFGCCWAGLAWNGPVLHFIKRGLTLWCYSHLLNLRVEDLPGAFLKPVHVHCTGNKDRRSGGSSDEKKDNKVFRINGRQTAQRVTQKNETCYRGFLILLELFVPIQSWSGDATQPKECTISSLLFHYIVLRPNLLLETYCWRCEWPENKVFRHMWVSGLKYAVKLWKLCCQIGQFFK